MLHLFSSGITLRFCLSGIVTTLLGSLSIFMIQLACGNAYLANALGYLAGAGFGYIIHSLYTFRSRPHWQNAMRYLATQAISFCANIASLSLMLRLANEIISQLVAIFTYALTSFLLLMYFAFGKSRIDK